MKHKSVILNEKILTQNVHTVWHNYHELFQQRTPFDSEILFKTQVRNIIRHKWQNLASWYSSWLRSYISPYIAHIEPNHWETLAPRRSGSGTRTLGAEVTKCIRSAFTGCGWGCRTWVASAAVTSILKGNKNVGCLIVCS